MESETPSKPPEQNVVLEEERKDPLLDMGSHPICVDHDMQIDDTVLPVSLSPPRTTMKTKTACFYIPKGKASRPFGQDAFFICDDKQTFGVADGVGSWDSKGIDAGIYARELMDNVFTAVNNHVNGDEIDLRKVLSEAYLKTKAKGTSTACILTLKGDILHGLNVGDSGFMVIRHGVVVYRSPIQQHKFNTPYQLGQVGVGKGQTPDIAEDIYVPVEDDDVVVAATDGLFDNLFHGQIEKIVGFGRMMDDSPEEIAAQLALKARSQGLNNNAIIPFNINAEKAGTKHTGGKFDDVTVIVAYISSGSLRVQEPRSNDGSFYSFAGSGNFMSCVSPSLKQKL